MAIYICTDTLYHVCLANDTLALGVLSTSRGEEMDSRTVDRVTVTSAMGRPPVAVDGVLFALAADEVQVRLCV